MCEAAELSAARAVSPTVVLQAVWFVEFTALMSLTRKDRTLVILDSKASSEVRMEGAAGADSPGLKVAWASVGLGSLDLMCLVGGFPLRLLEK